MSVQQRIDEIVKQNHVVLFMKGTRVFPQCGFSARAVEIFKACGIKQLKDVNVLADPELRQGIKDYSSWPTIPQVYVGGKFLGGSDILLEMYESGELHEVLGLEREAPTPVKTPKVTLTPAAAQAFGGALDDAGDDVLRFEVGAGFRYDLHIGPKEKSDLPVTSAGVTLYVAASAADKVDGTVIDFVEGPSGAGFKIDNPNEPATVKPMSATELKARLDAGEELHVFDVRTEKERAMAKIEPSTRFDDAAEAELEALPKGAPLVFICHHGIRSQGVAQTYLGKGYTNVYNLTGGIDAWSVQIDSSVPRY